MAELTPYDTAERLEPRVWVHDGITGSEYRRPSETDDYGRVDFDADDGTSVLTIYIERADYGYQMRVDQHSDEYVHVMGANEPPVLREPTVELDREYRARQMMMLDAGLREIADTFTEHVSYTDEGDPFAFSPGNFYFYPSEMKDGTYFAVEEEFARGTDWADDERVPIGWSWHESGLVRLPDGTTRADRVAEGTTIPSDIESLIARARAWVQTVSQNAEANTADRDLRRTDPHHEGPAR